MNSIIARNLSKQLRSGLNSNYQLANGKQIVMAKNRQPVQSRFACIATLPKFAEIVIIGGGIIGSLTAVWLANRIPGNSVYIIERDLNYTIASSVLAPGSIRVQYSVPENIYMSIDSFKYLKDVGTHLYVDGDDPPDIQMMENGYLFLASEKMVPLIDAFHEIHKKLNVPTEILQPSEIKEKFPWLNADGIVKASYGAAYEAMFNSEAYLAAAKKKAQSLGVTYVEAEVNNIKRNGNRIDKVLFRTKSGESGEIACGTAINAAGAWSGRIAELAGIGTKTSPPDLMTPLPVRPCVRYIYVFECRDGPKHTPTVVVDSSTSVGFRRETSGLYIAGVSPKKEEEPDNSNLDVDFNFFHKKVWPGLAARCKAFNGLKIVSAWAGYYDVNTLDNNAIIGPHPTISNFYFSTGFSGHGLQHSPAAARAITELILDGKFTTLDLSKFSFDRIIRNEPYTELVII